MPQRIVAINSVKQSLSKNSSFSQSSYMRSQETPKSRQSLHVKSQQSHNQIIDGVAHYENSPRQQNQPNSLPKTPKANVDKKRLFDGEFFTNDRIVKRAFTSLCCKIDNQNKCRQVVVSIIESKWFDRLIMTCIIINSLTMAMNDYEYDNHCAFEYGTKSCYFENQNRWNQVLNIIGSVFLWIFTLEALLKIFALGAFFGYKTYFKNAWNILDFIIVVAGITEFALELYQVQGVNMRVLRILRILRPLKAMKTLPSLRKQVQALLMSILGLVNVLVFLSFIFVLFSVIGLQWFGGSSHYACRTKEQPTEGPWLTYTEITGDTEFSGICAPDSNQLFPQSFTRYKICPENYVCASPLDVGQELRGLNRNAAIQFGIGSFDTIGQSLLAVFQIITLDSWSVIAYNLSDYHAAPIIPALFCVILIFMGSFFLLNLFLAVVMESYMESESKFNSEEAQALEEEQRILEERQNQLEKTQTSPDHDNSQANLIAVKTKPLTKQGSKLVTPMTVEEDPTKVLKGFALLKHVIAQQQIKQEQEKVLSEQSKSAQDLSKSIVAADSVENLAVSSQNSTAKANTITNQSMMKQAVVQLIQMKLGNYSKGLGSNMMKRAMSLYVMKRLHRICLQTEQNKRDIKKMKKQASEALECGDAAKQELVQQQLENRRKKLILSFRSALFKKYNLETHFDAKNDSSKHSEENKVDSLVTQGNRYGIQNEQIMVNNVRDTVEKQKDENGNAKYNSTLYLKMVQKIKKTVERDSKKEVEIQKEMPDNSDILAQQKIEVNNVADNYKLQIQIQAINARAEKNKVY